MLQKRPALFERLLRIYMDFAPKAMAELKVGLSQSNFALINATAHSLKSSSANVGAATLADLCKKLEAVAVLEDATAVAQLIATLDRAFAAVSNEINSELHRLGCAKVA